MSKFCWVCMERKTNGSMCTLCGKSYDRYFADGYTALKGMKWAAKRARRFERIRHQLLDTILGLNNEPRH